MVINLLQRKPYHNANHKYVILTYLGFAILSRNKATTSAIADAGHQEVLPPANSILKYV